MHVGETLVFRPLGNTFLHFRGVSCPSVWAAVASKKHTFAKPMKNLSKINDFGLSWVGLGCSRGPPCRPSWAPGGAQQAAKEVLGGSICVLDGIWGVSGATLGPHGSPVLLLTARCLFILVPFRLHFGVFLFFVLCLLKRNTQIKTQTK